MKQYLVLRVVTALLIPFILLFALYVQTHGEYGPGGGFQAGVILAAAFILFCLIFGLERSQQVVSTRQLTIFAVLGCLLYTGTGIVSMFLGGKFLEYGVLASTQQAGQKLGIFTIELGVGLTVFSVMLMLFYLFVERKRP